MMRPLPSFAAFLGSSIALSMPATAETPVSFYSGLSYTTGDYGLDEDTTVTRIPLGLSVDTGAITLFGEAAYISADGYVGAIQQYTSGSAVSRLRSRLGLGDATDNEIQSVSGWGDMLFGASVRLTPSPADYYTGITITGSAPTGDEDQGLGAGDWSWSASLDGEKRWSDFTLGASLGGVYLGEDSTSAADNTETLKTSYAFASLRAGYDISPNVTTGLSLSWAQSSSEDFDDQMEAALTAGWRLNERVYLGSYASAGLTEASPDLGIGLTLSWTPTRRNAP